MGMPKFINDYLNYDVEAYVDAVEEPPTGDTLIEWEEETVRNGIRIGLKYAPDRSAFIASATSTATTELYPNGWCITAFGGDSVSAKHKLWVVLTVYGGALDIDAAWLAIGEHEREIKKWLVTQLKTTRQSNKKER